MNTGLHVALRGVAAGLLAGLLAACQPSTPPAPTGPTPSPAASVPQSPPAAAPVAAAPAVPLLEQDVAYGEGQKTNLVGFLAMPRDAAEPLPGLIVIHEWWGLNDQIKNVTRRLAAEGYVALAVDLYDGATATTPEKAQQLMTTHLGDVEVGRKNLRQAYDYLEKYALAPRIGSIGWDLGGAWSLQTALLYPDQLDAAVLYYGQVLAERDQLAKLKMPLLGFFGSEDKSIPVRDVQTFRSTLNDLGKNAEILVTIGANHGFAIPGNDNYDQRFADEAWNKTLEFLRHNLKVADSAQ
ncbi:MAG TPA: dienelactone hydrolase family protein [Gammaproteobacteria bacterium]|jgi:carboxymethylenebutenolidase|nr:dienelactone hydrolase family protein [Gammaproteobacteria bacterium]